VYINDLLKYHSWKTHISLFIHDNRTLKIVLTRQLAEFAVLYLVYGCILKL